MVRLKIEFSIKKEINDLNQRIKDLENLLRDGKLMAAGNFKRHEIFAEIEELKHDRNILLKVQ